MTILTLAYDMRAPDFGARPAALYRAALDQCEWADNVGFDAVGFMEHHASTDGYLPSPIVLAAAAAARTSGLQIGVTMLLPLYHPLRAAEDLAVLDLIAGGRVRLTAVAGYRQEEYAQFGLDMRDRPSLMESSIEALKSAWTGEAFVHDGTTVRVLPRPAQQPRPDIVMGGSTAAAARRAARIADGFRPVVPELMAVYARELADLGNPVPDMPKPTGDRYMFLHVTEDPTRDWGEIAPHALHDNNEYARWLQGAPNPVYKPVSDADELLESGICRVVTPDQCLEMARRDGMLSFKPLFGGLDPAVAWRSLRLVEREVLPALNPR